MWRGWGVVGKLHQQLEQKKYKFKGTFQLSFADCRIRCHEFSIFTTAIGEVPQTGKVTRRTAPFSGAARSLSAPRRHHAAAAAAAAPQ